MVMKSHFAKEKQKPDQLPRLHLQAQAQQQRNKFAWQDLPLEQSKADLCSSSSDNHNRHANVFPATRLAVVNPGERILKGSGNSVCSSKRFFQSTTLSVVSRLTLVVLLLISSLTDKPVHGAKVNSSLEIDLLMNSNISVNSDGSIISDFVSTPATTSTSRTTTGTGSATAIADDEASSHTTSSITPLPPYANNSNLTNLNISYESATRPSSAVANGATSQQVNFTLPIQVTPDSAIIVKQGSIIYEVINNGTVSTNYQAFSIPFLTATGKGAAIGATSRNDPRMLYYEKMTATVLGLRVEETAKGVTYNNGASKILANSPAIIRFFGMHFTNNTIVRFVSEEGIRGEDCDDVSSSKYFHFESKGLTPHTAVTTVTIPPLNDGEHMYYVCVREDNTEMPWIHQGPENWIVITTYEKWLPLWAHIILLVLLLVLSGLFSGLNLGLMAIDRTEIKIIINSGSDKDRRYAKKIQPLRDNGNYLLCSLLLGNVLVNASLTILLDDLTSGLIAVIGSTVGIVIFGEIVPQAVCSRHGLAVGAKTVWITKFFMAATFPLSFPISVILNKVLGEEIGTTYTRERLKELIRVTQGANDLENDEVNIISGALDLKQKTVVDVMTRLEDVYMLPIDAILDFDTVSEIMSNGYSRIPVYEGQRGNVVSLLYAKDLAFVDPDDKMPLRTICEFYSNPCHFVFENVTLNVLFNVFKQGNKGHMAFVQRVKASDKVDPLYEVIGLVTMEDVIEELIQEEINDETDVWETDNKRRSQGNYSAITDVTMPRLKTDVHGTTVSPQLTLAAFQYLSTAVQEFHDSIISKAVLERLLKQNIYFHIKIKVKDTPKIDPSTILYERGKPADYFIMVLEGRVLAEVGKESLVFESGPFTYFGTKSLLLPIETPTSQTPAQTRKTSQISQISFVESSMPPTFIPDYTVRAVTDLTYFQISRSMYLAAKQATLLEKSYSSTDSGIMSEDKIDEHSENTLDEVVETPDSKSKETSITMAKSTGRGSISENQVKGVKEGSRNVGSVTVPPPIQQQLKQMQNPAFIDNNNVSKGTTNNGDLVSEDLGRSNLSRMILCPVDQQKPSEL